MVRTMIISQANKQFKIFLETVAKKISALGKLFSYGGDWRTKQPHELLRIIYSLYLYSLNHGRPILVFH